MARETGLGPRYDAVVDHLMQTGRYGSVEDVMRDGLDLLEQMQREPDAEVQAIRRSIEDNHRHGTHSDIADVRARLAARYARKQQ